MNPLPATAGRPLSLPEPARQLLLRPRLLTTLQQRFERRLTTLVAGPGFGKTSLLAERRPRTGYHRVAWMRG